MSTQNGRRYAKGYSEAGASFRKRALKAFSPDSGSPREDIDFNNMTLRRRARLLYMASPVAAGAVNTSRTKIIGSGLHMKCAIDRELLRLSDESAKKWEKNTQAEWRMWCENKDNCDAAGMNNFYELQQAAALSWQMSGDVFALLKRAEATQNNPYTLRIQLVEADRVCTPDSAVGGTWQRTDGVNKENGNRIFDGVEVDGDGRVTAYHISNVYPGEITDEKQTWERVERIGQRTLLPNVIHVFTAERPSQHRGVSALASSIEALLQLRRYTESELTAAIVQTYLTAWITTTADPTENPLNEVGYEDGYSVSDYENDYEMGPGQINHLEPGESITFGNPNIPQSGFDAFVASMIKQVGAAMEIPYEVLVKEFQSSYSASKGALEEAQETFKMKRSWFVSDFCQPIYETWLTEAVASGRIKAPGFFTDPKIRAAWCSTRWDGPVQSQLDPLKEAKANEIEVAHGWKTNEQVTREIYGGDWFRNASQAKDEAAAGGAADSF